MPTIYSRRAEQALAWPEVDMRSGAMIAGVLLCAGILGCGDSAGGEQPNEVVTDWIDSLAPVSYTHLTLPTKRIV